MPRAAAAREIPPPLELLCLRALWSLGEANVRDVQQAVASAKPLAYTTVMTLLERLARKGVVSRRKAGRAFRYAPKAERDVLRRIALREFLDAHFDGSEEQLREFLAAQHGARRAGGGPEIEPEPRLDTALL
jgi:BlaI family transcriptional regulator, penicillinase repressor